MARNSASRTAELQAHGQEHILLLWKAAYACRSSFDGPDRFPKGQHPMVHVTDIFSTLLSITGWEVPSDRPIDGVDQTTFFRDPVGTKSPRIGFLFYIREELRAIKWKDWKLHLVWEPKVNQSSGRLESPYLFNTVRDPKEESDILAFNTWVMQPMMKLKTESERSLKYDPKGCCLMQLDAI